jgi:hypothetical protein
MVNSFKYKLQKLLFLFSFLACFCCIYGQTGISIKYNIVWNTPSKDALESMPLSGRKGTGANVWVQNGALWIYLAHNGAYDEFDIDEGFEVVLWRLSVVRNQVAAHDMEEYSKF